MKFGAKIFRAFPALVKPSAISKNFICGLQLNHSKAVRNVRNGDHSGNRSVYVFQ